jgi:hypothetical protein
VSLASFGLICVSVLAGSTFSKDAFDQQIFVNRWFASNVVIPAVSKNGIVRDLTGDDNIAVEITDLLRAKTTELQWVKVIGKPQYSFTDGHAYLLVKAYSECQSRHQKTSCYTEVLAQQKPTVVT